MRNLANLILLLASTSVSRAKVSPFGDAMGKNLMNMAYSAHWLRALDAPDDCDGTASAGDMITDPDDCTRFYVCRGPGDPSPISYACSDIDPSYECFDPASGDCSDNASNECDAACPASTCQTECSAQGDQIADMNDCKRHYICLGAGPDADTVLIDCPNDLPYFDGSKCGTDKSACCNCQQGTCATPGDKLPDPADCHSYFICVEIAGTLTPLRTPCEDGGSFVNGDCDSSITECDPLCDLGGDGSTPEPSSTTSDESSTTSSISTSATTLSTSTTSTTTTSTPTTIPGCIDISDFTCPGHGYYPRCPYCDPSYFSCDGISNSPSQGVCSGDLVFNPTPGYPYCVLPGNCPIS